MFVHPLILTLSLNTKLTDKQITTDFMKAGSQWERKKWRQRRETNPFHGDIEIYKNKLLPIPLITGLHFHYMEYLNYHIFMLVIQLLYFRTKNLTDLRL